jgi:hypothetical protein
MNPENYKTKRQGQPKRTSPLSKSKTRMLRNAEVAKTYNSPKLCEIYNTKTQWIAKTIPKLKEK